MIPPAHPSVSVPALATGNQIDGGFYKGFFRSLLEATIQGFACMRSQVGQEAETGSSSRWLRLHRSRRCRATEALHSASTTPIPHSM
jgi:hypothetical protein